MRSPACSIATRPRGVLNARGVFLACSASSHSADLDRLYTLLLLLALPLPLLLRLLLLLLRLLRLMRLLLLLVLPFTFLVPLLVKCFALAHGWDLEGRVNSRAIPTLHRRWRRRRVASKTLRPLCPGKPLDVFAKPLGKCFRHCCSVWGSSAQPLASLPLPVRLSLSLSLFCDRRGRVQSRDIGKQRRLQGLCRTAGACCAERGAQPNAWHADFVHHQQSSQFIIRDGRPSHLAACAESWLRKLMLISPKNGEGGSRGRAQAGLLSGAPALPRAPARRACASTRCSGRCHPARPGAPGPRPSVLPSPQPLPIAIEPVLEAHRPVELLNARSSGTLP